MANLSEGSRERIIGLVGHEQGLLEQRIGEVFRVEWLKAEKELRNELGILDEEKRAEKLEKRIEALQDELRQLHSAHKDYRDSVSVEGLVAAGFDVRPDQYGGLYEWPQVFQRTISTKWDLEVFNRVDDVLHYQTIRKALGHVSHGIQREIALSGTFDDARKAYKNFYDLLRDAVGDTVPPLLGEILNTAPQMLLPAGEDRAANEK